MKVANPLYDVVFKYLMQDMRVAKLVISNIIEQEIESLDRRLHKASASKELCDDMNMEDEILEELATQERVIAYERAEKEKAEAEKARLEKLLKQAGIEF